MKHSRLLIATDFSESSQTAVARGVNLACQLESAVHLLHIVSTGVAALVPPPEIAPNPERWFRELHERAAQLMDELVRKTDFQDCSLTTQVIEAEHCGPAILDYAKEHEIDIIVMGTHGRRGLRRMMMGSVAEEVLRLAQCAVLTCTEESGERPEWPRELLAAIDFSPLSDTVLRVARDLSTLYRAPLRVIHSVPQPYYPPEYAPISGGVILEALPQMLDSAREALDQRINAVDEFSEEITTEVVSGSASEAILTKDAAGDIDMIIMGSRGLTGAQHLLLGSVADKVVRRAKCPVLTLHADLPHSAVDPA